MQFILQESELARLLPLIAHHFAHGQDCLPWARKSCRLGLIVWILVIVTLKNHHKMELMALYYRLIVTYTYTVPYVWTCCIFIYLYISSYRIFKNYIIIFISLCHEFPLCFFHGVPHSNLPCPEDDWPWSEILLESFWRLAAPELRGAVRRLGVPFHQREKNARICLNLFVSFHDFTYTSC